MDQFTPGETVVVTVAVSNPLVNAGDLGAYMFSIKTHAPGAGIGTGSGFVYTLQLKVDTFRDTTPPTVSIGKPVGDQILGVVPVEITANDPAPGTGVASISATINSLGGAVPLQALALTAAGLPQGAGSSGTPITATGTFAPFGAMGTAGTTLAAAFTSTVRSGIDTYSIRAQAVDGAGNIGFAANIFKIKYNVSFTLAFVPNGCPGGNASNPNFNSCNGMFEFKAKRSNITSDGAFMFDTTVVLKMVRTSDNVVVATHACTGSCTGGAIHANVQINESNKLYKSHFKHSDLDTDPNTAGIQAPTTLNEYRVDVYFMDVDGNQTFQGSCPALML